MKTPGRRSVAVWTTSQLMYDQRILRIKSVMEAMDMRVEVYDRQTEMYRAGRISTKRTGGPGFYLEYNARISRLARTLTPDLHYAADIDVMPGLMLGLRRKKKIPLLLDLHEWYPEVIELSGRPVKRKIWEKVERISVHRADACMTVNQSLSRIFEEKYGKTFTVVRNAPELRTVQTEDAHTRFSARILYYQGVLNEGRGLEGVIVAMKNLPEWRLWLAGEGDLSQALRERVRTEGLDGQVRFFGRLAPEALPDLAGQATIGLNLLKGDSRSYYYSLANKYFDYIHSGLPAVHMDFPEYSDLMKAYPTGGLLDKLSSASFVDLVKRITRSYETYEAMTKACERAAKEYHWEKEAAKLKGLLVRIMK